MERGAAGMFDAPVAASPVAPLRHHGKICRNATLDPPAAMADLRCGAAGSGQLCADEAHCLEACQGTPSCEGVQVLDEEPFCTLHADCEADLANETSATYLALPAGVAVLRFPLPEAVPEGAYRACFCDAAVTETGRCESAGDFRLDIGSVTVSSLACSAHLQPDAARCAAQATPAGGQRCSHI